MYDYHAHEIAPRAVEFHARTHQGHRIVRVYLDTPDPRITAFNESSGSRSYATLWKSEIDLLIQRARDVCFPPPSPSTERKDHQNEDG